MVAERERRRRSPRRPGGDRRRLRPTARAVSQSTSRMSSSAHRARWSPWTSAWVPIDQAIGVAARTTPNGEGEPGARRQPMDEDDRQGGGRGQADGVEQVHPERRLAERLEARSRRASPGSRRSGSRSDGPSRAAARPSGARPCPRTPRRAGASRTAIARANAADPERGERRAPRPVRRGARRSPSEQVTPDHAPGDDRDRDRDEDVAEPPAPGVRPRAPARRGAGRTARSRC